eukprot:SAG31_NODE_10384_length_1145_cov_1.261950_1_plen_163_part_00
MKRRPNASVEHQTASEMTVCAWLETLWSALWRVHANNVCAYTSTRGTTHKRAKHPQSTWQQPQHQLWATTQFRCKTSAHTRLQSHAGRLKPRHRQISSTRSISCAQYLGTEWTKGKSYQVEKAASWNSVRTLGEISERAAAGQNGNINQEHQPKESTSTYPV